VTVPSLRLPQAPPCARSAGRGQSTGRQPSHHPRRAERVQRHRFPGHEHPSIRRDQPVQDKVLQLVCKPPETEPFPLTGPEALCGSIPVSANMEAALDRRLPRHLAADHTRRRDVCLKHSVCSGAVRRDTQDKLPVLSSLRVLYSMNCEISHILPKDKT